MRHRPEETVDLSGRSIGARDDEGEVDRQALLTGYDTGYRPAPWSEGRAKLIPKGAGVEDYSELGIYFAKEAQKERVLSLAPADSKLAIPPGDAQYPSSARATFTRDVKLISMQQHMHLRGKDFDIRATYADGRTDALLRVPRFDFRWRTIYFVADPIQSRSFEDRVLGRSELGGDEHRVH